MLKKLLCITAVAAGLSSCDKTGKMETLPSGLRYQFHVRDEDGKKAKLGDIVTLKLAVRNSKDSTLGGSAEAPGGVMPVQVQQAPFKGSWEEGLTLLSIGDSVTFFVNSDTLFAKTFAGQPIPPQLSKAIVKGSDIKFTVKVSKIQNQQEIDKEKQEASVKQKTTDAKLIDEYVAKNKLANVQKTASGLNYIITTAGTGKQPTATDTVTVHYTLKTLDGKVLESSVGKDPFTTPLNMVIPGWTEGVALMKEGSKGTLIIPSGLAYGAQGGGPLPANSVLVFDVELLKVK